MGWLPGDGLTISYNNVQQWLHVSVMARDWRSISATFFNWIESNSVRMTFIVVFEKNTNIFFLNKSETAGKEKAVYSGRHNFGLAGFRLS